MYRCIVSGISTESAIIQTLETYGVFISSCTVSRILTDDKEAYHQEKKDIVAEGIVSCLPKQMDDTGARVSGKNQYAHILCNGLFTAYFTRPHKDRLTLLEILSQGTLTFKANKLAYALMEKMKLPAKFMKLLKVRLREKTLNRKKMDALLTKLFPDPEKHIKNRKIVLEACAIAAYQALPHAIQILLTDEAPQYNEITELLGSCWIHEGRHYKKLTPSLAANQKKVTAFLTRFWDYYRQLLMYKESPSPQKAEKLSEKFDKLFTPTTGYDALDKRIELTCSRKESLLLVLKHPELPLHNNASELGARGQARKRDISLHTMNKKGTEAKDTLMTIAETAKKHGVNIYHYFYDRITQKQEMPSLASLIKLASSSAKGSLHPPVPQAA